MPTTVSPFELIRRVPLFSTLTAAQAEIIATAVSKRRFKRGEIIVQQGTRSNALTIILAGHARVITADSRGREAILATLQPGDCVGEMSLLDNEPHSATVVADALTDTLVLGRDEFAHCLPEPNSLAHALMVGLVRRLRQADRKTESLALMDVYGRVARVLLESATQNANGQRVILGKVSRQDLAKTVGASREMVSRVMKDLEERGFIETAADHSVVIKDQLGTLG